MRQTLPATHRAHVIAVREANPEHMVLVPPADRIIRADDVLVILGGSRDIARIQAGTSINLLRAPIAALGGARTLAYHHDMSQVLRSVRLALGPLATVNRGAQAL